MPKLYADSHRGIPPFTSAAVITPSDTVAQNSEFRALWIGGAGALTVQLEADAAAVLISGIPAGTMLPIVPILVKDTGTTATLIVGLG